MTSRRNFFKTIGSFGALFSLRSIPLNFSSDDLPNVLIIGDSISMGYTPFLKAMLKDRAFVWHPDENCEGTTKGVLKIDEWIGTAKWNIIHFNFGLHDIKHVNAENGSNSNLPEDPPQANLSQYSENLKIIVEKLKSTGAKLIFATTTPVPQKSSPFRNPEDIVNYNNAALEIMKKQDIEVNNLYEFILPKIDQIQLPDNVHFKPEGYQVLAERVSDYILKAL